MNKAMRVYNLRGTALIALLAALLLAMVGAVESARTTYPSAKGAEPREVASSERHASRVFEKDGDIWLVRKTHLVNLMPNTTAFNDEDPSKPFGGVTSVPRAAAYRRPPLEPGVVGRRPPGSATSTCPLARGGARVGWSIPGSA
jgi:hypothetical protein